MLSDRTRLPCIRILLRASLVPLALSNHLMKTLPDDFIIPIVGVIATGADLRDRGLFRLAGCVGLFRIAGGAGLFRIAGGAGHFRREAYK